MSTKQLTPAQQIRGDLERMRPEFKKALPPHIPVDRFIRVAQTAITSNPSLMNCSKQSLFAACTRAAEMALLPNGVEGAIVPYGDKATWMSMIAGKMKLARNSGEIKTLDSQIIHQNDAFKYWIDETGSHLNFEPNFLGDRGDVIGAFAIGVTKDGGTYIELMSNEQIAAIESQSKGKNTPWKGPFRSEMIRKSVMNRLLKRMPTSTDIDMDMENDYNLTGVNSDPEPEQEEVQIDEPQKEKDVTAPAKLTAIIEEEVPL